MRVPGVAIPIASLAGIQEWYSDQSAESVPLYNGIPAAWADAGLFRVNHFPIQEDGSFEDLFSSLKEGEFDYAALGANEIVQVYRGQCAPDGSCRPGKNSGIPCRSTL